MSALRPLETASLSDRVTDTLREAIVTGELGPGALIRDRQMAEELGVSRTPVRDALYRLRSEGLTQPRGRAGWYVVPFTEKDVRELFQLRKLIEPHGLEMLEQESGSRGAEQIAQVFDGFSHPISLDRHPEYFERDDEFHELIVSFTQNTRLIAFYANLKAHINRGRHILAGSSAERVEGTLDEHQAIVEAIVDGDYPKARTALIDHLRTGEELMVLRLRNLTEE